MDSNSKVYFCSLQVEVIILSFQSSHKNLNEYNNLPEQPKALN